MTSDVDASQLKAHVLPLRRYDLLYLDEEHLSEIANPHFTILPYVAIPSRDSTHKHRNIAKYTFKNYPLDRIRIVQGIDHALTIQATVISIAMGFKHSKDQTDPVVQAIELAIFRHRVAVVTAAGNSGPKEGTLQALAYAKGVIAVGATSTDGRLLDCSSRGGTDGVTPTCVADGELSTPDERFPPSTSFAASRVSGLLSTAITLSNIVLSIVNDILNNVVIRQTSVFLPSIALLDTGAPLDGIPVNNIFKTASQKHGRYINLQVSEDWIEGIKTLCEGRELQLPAVCCNEVLHWLVQAMCVPVGGHHAKAVGYGSLSELEVYGFFREMTIGRFLYTYCKVRLSMPDNLCSMQVSVFTEECFDILWSYYRHGVEIVPVKIYN